jgi:serine/threonine-protein kinase
VEAANRLAETLRVKLLAGEESQIQKKPTESTDAYLLYLKGRLYWNERTREGTEKAIRYFESAIEADPTYSSAYSGLADCYLTEGQRGWMHPRLAAKKAKALAMKALRADEHSAEAHATLAMALTHARDFRKAELELAQAIELKPSYATAHQWRGILLHLMDNQEAAYEACKRALDLDPFSLVIGTNLATYLTILGRFEDAQSEFKRLLKLYPTSPELHHFVAICYLHNSMLEQAIREEREAVKLSNHDPKTECDLAFVLGVAGKREEALGLLAELRKPPKQSRVRPAFLAFALLAVGKEEDAFDLLERAHDEDDVWVLHFRVDPWYARYRRGKRWLALKRNLDMK